MFGDTIVEKIEQSVQIDITEETVNKWQNIVDNMAEIIGIPD
jgi:hypothetical protein